MSLEEMVSNIENSIKELKDFLVQENLLVANPDDESALIENQDPDAVEAYNARKFLDVRF